MSLRILAHVRCDAGSCRSDLKIDGGIMELES